MNRPFETAAAPVHPLTAGGVRLRAAAPMRGRGVRLVSCAMALSACAEATPSPRPVSVAPAPLSPPRQPPKAQGDPSLADWADNDAATQAPTGAQCADAVPDCGVDRVCLELWPGGFCTGACTEDAHCPGAGSTCLVPSGWPEGMEGFCMLACDSDEACMPGYACDGLHCWPVPMEVL